MKAFLYLFVHQSEIVLLSRVANPRQQTYLEYTRTSGVEKVYIAGKACEEHTACEGKAFEE